MNFTALKKTFKPNTIALGYGLFFAVNAVGAWGGVFPFLPKSLQEPDLMFLFFFVHSGTFTLAFFASILGAYYHPNPTRKFIVRLSAIPYALGWICIIGGMYIKAFIVQFAIAGAILIGLGSAGFFMLWQRLFASMSSDRGNHLLILGTLYASIFFFALYIIPQAITVYLIPLAITPIVALIIALESRKINVNQPMFDDIPSANSKTYKEVLIKTVRPALCVASLALCAGLVRAIIVANPSLGIHLNTLSMAASLLAASTLLILWQFKSIRFNVVSMFRFIFPIVITCMTLLPFLNHPYDEHLAAILYATYNITIILLMMQSAQLSRDYGINPVFIYGFFGGIVYAFHDLGFIGGTTACSIQFPGMSHYAVATICTVYLLGFMYFYSQGGFRNAYKRNSVPDIELVSLCPIIKTKASITSKPESKNKHTTKQDCAPDQGIQDRISKQMVTLKAHYRLTAREAEIMELMVRGRTVYRIAEELVISENTVRMHSKNIYSKLNVHKKQEMIDLVETFKPSNIPEPPQ